MHIALFEAPLVIEDDGVQTIGIGYEQLLGSFISKEKGKFQVFAQDSKSYRYYSKQIGRAHV